MEVHCRLCLAPGLWLLVRWPARLTPSSCGEDSSTEPACAGSPIACRPPGERPPIAHVKPRLADAAHATGAVATRRWFEACKRAVASGLALEVLGVWG